MKKVPEEFGMPNYNQNLGGLRWQMQDKNGNHNIRIDRGNPGADYPTQQVDHVAISYQSRVVDHTGKNYILKDEVSGGTFKIERSKFDAGKRGVENGFEINMQVKRPADHPDAHIPAAEWITWKNFHKPD